MTTPSALHTLIELAGTESDDAAKRLGQAVRTGEEAEQKLALLVQYRDDYAARLQNGMGAGLPAADYRNYQSFIGKLDQAIDGQRRVVEQAQQRVGAERAAWQACERKRLSYGTLADRAQQREAVREQRRDQKQTDELAARQAYTKR
ncbi:MAG: flagellar export protein FliJ [Burkholderiaceae bacterium]